MTNKEILTKAKDIANKLSGKLESIIEDFRIELEDLLVDNKLIEDYDMLDYVNLNKDLDQIYALLDNVNSIENGMDELDLTIQDIYKILEK